MTRIYLPINLAAGNDVALPPDVVHRLLDVQRAAIGEQLTVFNGQGGEYRAVVRELSRHTGSIHLERFDPISRESSLGITLAQGLARGEKMDYTIQKAVELGAQKIVPLATARSQVKLDPARAAKRREHWQSIVISACEQCGRSGVPEVTHVVDVDEFIAVDDAQLGLILNPHSDENVSDALRHHASGASISLVIGPEGGLDPREIAMLTTAGYLGVRLGPRVLRTETAALVALTALQILAGDLLSKSTPHVR